MTSSRTLTSYRDLTVGDTVTVPGHRRSDPSTTGTLVEITEMTFARGGKGYFVKVEADGRRITSAVGLCRKVTS